MFEAFNEAWQSIMNNQLYIIIIAIVLFLVGTLILFVLRQKPKSQVDDDFEDTLHELSAQTGPIVIGDVETTQSLPVSNDDLEHIFASMKNMQAVEQNRVAATYLFSLEAVCKTVIHRFYQVKLWSHNANHYDHAIDRVDQVNKNLETISHQFNNANIEDMGNN